MGDPVEGVVVPSHQGPVLPTALWDDCVVAEHIEAVDAFAHDLAAQYHQEAQDAAQTRAYHEWLDRNELEHSQDAHERYVDHMGTYRCNGGDGS